MNIALMAEDSKKELMVQFCLAYCGILAHHNLYATDTTGRLVTEETGLPVHRYLSHAHGGIQQIGARVDLNEIDMVLFFIDPTTGALFDEANYISILCDANNIPFTTNIATAEVLIQGLQCGDLDWRDIVNPKNKA